MDLRHAVRALSRSPVFVVTAVLSIAVGVAAAATIFSVADALFLRPPPGVRDPGPLVDVGRSTRGSGYGPMSYPVFQHLRDHARTLDGLAATTMDPTPLSLRDGTSTSRVFGTTVSAAFFDVLGVRPVLGRFFRPDEDDVADASPVAVVTYQFWSDRLGADPAVVGRTVHLNRTPFTIIGVAEPGFSGSTLLATDLWIPIGMAGIARGEPGASLLANARTTWVVAIGRLAAGVGEAQTEAEVNTLLTTFRATTPDVPAEHGVTVTAAGRVPPSVRSRFASFIGLLLAFAGALLAIACSNVAGMQLARATTRHREVATRLALGASRWRIVQLMLVETALICGTAAVVAVPLTVGLLAGFAALLPAFPVPVQLDLVVSYRAMVAGGVVALATSLFFGLAPTRHTLRLDFSPMLHGRSSTDGGRRLRLRHALLVGQVALALVLITTAGLFARALQRAATIDTGFDARDVSIVTLDLAAAGMADDRISQTAEAVVDRLTLIGGVQAAGYARMVPLFSGSLALGGIRLPGRAEADHATLERTNWDAVSPNYFTTLRLPITLGRPFTSEDRQGSQAVAIVNETFARLAWPGQSAVGQQFWQTRSQGETPEPDQLLQVVGVARDAKSQTIDEGARPFVYVPFFQHPQTKVEVFLRHVPDGAIERDIRPAIGAVAPDVPVVSIHRFEESIAGGVFPQRLAAWTASVVGVTGILLAGLGLYGLVAFVAVQRTRELAIRLALGARRVQVAWLVAGQALAMTALGSTAGLLLAWMLGRVLQSSRLLLGVPAGDPLAFAGAAATLLLVVLVACYRPLRRAAATDPALTLRGE